MKDKKKQKKGIVYFVGAGPGDPGLLTLKGREALEQADVIIHDWLIGEGILNYAPQALKIDVGKSPYSRARGHHAQQEINRFLIRHARQGKTVVRLKGGDPLVFGRGGEEAAALAKSGIAFEFVPGITAGTGVPAYAGIPLTDRRISSTVTFVTGHEDPSKEASSIDWPSLARLGGTLVLFMGVGNLSQIVNALMRAGKPRATLISVIEWGTLSHQRVIEGTLSTIAAKVKKEKIQSPSLIVIGDVNALRRRLSWYDKKPLKGRTVLVTRSRDQAGTLKHALEREGARVLEFHAIRILPPASTVPVRDALRRLGGYDWAVFTSTNGVEHVFRQISAMGKDSRIFSGVKLAAIGEATRQALETQGLKADLVPRYFHSESLVESLHREESLKGKKVFLFRTDIAPPYLKEALRRSGARVEEVIAYRTRPNIKERSKLSGWLKKEKIDFVTFTSSSTVDSFLAALGPQAKKRLRARFVSIGPVTSRTLRGYGLRPYCEAREHTVGGLVTALVQKLSS